MAARIRALLFLLPFIANVAFYSDVAANEEVNAIQARIDSLGLRWRARETSLMRLSPEERTRYSMDPSYPEPTAPHWEGYSPKSARIDRAVLDWRDFGGDYVSGVRDQSTCGSCWDFAATAAMESAFLLAVYQGGVLGEIDLSEQRILSCLDDYTEHDGDCDGGHSSVASWFGETWGMVEERCFPYVADDTWPCEEQCPDSESKTLYFADWGWVCTEEPNVNAIIDALNYYGPLAAWMDAPPDFAAYSEGIYQAPGKGRGGHYVLIVGYNTEEQYWIGKNSWGEDWGMDGFFFIAWDSGCDFGRWTSHIAFNPAGVGPIARFELAPEEVFVGESVSFQDSSIAVNAPIVAWEWDFDQDSIVDSYEQNPSDYVYNSHGTYYPLLRVIDSQGYSHETVREVSVLPEVLNVAGNVSGTWTSDRTYLVVNDIEVAHGSSLVIEPGCQILFDGFYTLNNYGQIQAVGTEEERIHFSSSAEVSHPGDWNCIAFRGTTASGLLEYCLVEYAKYGAIFDATGPSNIQIRNCIFTHEQKHGLYSFSGSAPLIENNEIFANGSQGIECVSSPGPNVPTIRQNRIYENTYHGLYISTASPIVVDNDIYGNHSRGITCKVSAAPLISGNVIHGNAYVGILSEGANPLIEHNAVYGNGSLGIWIGDGSECQLENNTIVDNGSSGIYSEMSSVTFINNVIARNGFCGIDFVAGECLVLYNDVWGNSILDYLGGTLPEGIGVISSLNANGDPCDDYHNISMDPVFDGSRDLDCGDYCIQETSPCVDAGNPSSEYQDPDGTIADIGAYYYGYTPVLIENFQVELGDGACEISWKSSSNWEYMLKGECNGSTWVVPHETAHTGNCHAEDSSVGQYWGNPVTYTLFGLPSDSDWVLLEVQTVDLPLALLPTGIHSAFPNPFNPTLTIAFTLNENTRCRLTVVDVSGREVCILKDEIMPRGEHQVEWTGIDLRGMAMASGFYFIQMESRGIEESTKVVLIR